MPPFPVLSIRGELLSGRRLNKGGVLWSEAMSELLSWVDPKLTHEVKCGNLPPLIFGGNNTT
jgi:hypothetical protein